MALTETHGTVTTNGSENTILDDSTTGSHALHLFLNQLTTGDKVTVKVYIKDVQGATLRTWKTWSYSRTQTDPDIYIPMLQTSEYKVTITRNTGSDYTHNYNHEYYL